MIIYNQLPYYRDILPPLLKLIDNLKEFEKNEIHYFSKQKKIKSRFFLMI